MYFDRFDICEAYHCFATLYHGGQFSETYRIFGRLAAIGFECCCDNPDGLTENGRAIFDALVADAGFEPCDSEAA